MLKQPGASVGIETMFRELGASTKSRNPKLLSLTSQFSWRGNSYSNSDIVIVNINDQQQVIQTNSLDESIIQSLK